MAQLPTHAQAFLAPAKLNLDLRIIGRRADGYHLLESIFCLIDLCDIVHLAPRTDAEIILHTPAAGVAAEQDLSYRAAKALQQAASQGLARVDAQMLLLHLMQQPAHARCRRG